MEFPNGVKYALTPLSYAIITNNQQGINAILDVAKAGNILKEVLITVNANVEFPSGERRTTTPLGPCYRYALG